MGGVKVGGSCLFLQPLLPHHLPSSSPRTLASLFSSSSSSCSSIKTSNRRGSDCFCDTYNNNHMIISHQSDQLSTFLGVTASLKLSRRRSLDGDLNGRPRRRRGATEQALTRPFTASLYNGSTHHCDGGEADESVRRPFPESAFDSGPSIDIFPDYRDHQPEADTTSSVRGPMGSSAEPPWPALRPVLPNWPDRDEMKASSMDLPLFLRMIEHEERRGCESTCNSANKAFSCMVLIIRELHSYTLQMRETLFSENLQGILARVQTEMNASFVWLFQHIFSCTPTLMVYVMLLLANFTVYNLDSMAAVAAVSPSPPPHATATIVSENWSTCDDASSFLNISRTAYVGGSDGGGDGRAKPVAGATNEGGRSDGYSTCVIRTSFTNDDGMPTLMEEAAVTEEEEVVWNGIVEEASRMKARWRDEYLLDPGTLQGLLVSPVTVELEPEEYSEKYLQTELTYQKAVSQDPENVMLLSNFAQFLFLVLHDHDRAECYHKRAIAARPADAEALNRYASFLWLARNDLEGAEETYLEAIAADPGNSHYAASYAHFLWNTGGEDTCYPLDDEDTTSC